MRNLADFPNANPLEDRKCELCGEKVTRYDITEDVPDADPDGETAWFDQDGNEHGPDEFGCPYADPDEF